VTHAGFDVVVVGLRVGDRVGLRVGRLVGGGVLVYVTSMIVSSKRTSSSSITKLRSSALVALFSIL
jgi:hypothetical protein